MQCWLMALLFLVISILVNFPSISEARKDIRIKGYVKKGGRNASPHKRTSPNKSKIDNYGTKGIVNPNTGKVGRKEPFMPVTQKSR